MTKIQFRDNAYVDCFTTDSDKQNDITDIHRCVPVDDVGKLLGLPRDLNETAAVEVLALLAMLVILRVAIYCVLWFRCRKV